MEASGNPAAVTMPAASLGDGHALLRAGGAGPAGAPWPGPARRAGVPGSGRAAAARPAGDRSGAWLGGAAAGLAVLAGAASVVSFSAQYLMVHAARRPAVVAMLEAAIPDAAALVFACLGVALALHGRRALRARALNVAAVGTSVLMNAIAAAPGWRDAAIWVMPPVAYALASDTLIGVVRARAARQGGPLAGEDATPLAVLGGLVLWLLRLALAPASTLAGFRAGVLAEGPVAPGRRAPGPASPSRPRPARPSAGGGRPVTKTARFLALAEREHGPLAGIPLGGVGRISSQLAPLAGLHPGAARAALRKAVLAAMEGQSR